MHLGFTEILAIVIIVLLLFGPGRIEKLASEMGKGIRSFREGLQGNKDKKEEEEKEKDIKQPARKKARKKSK